MKCRALALHKNVALIRQNTVPGQKSDSGSSYGQQPTPRTTYAQPGSLSFTPPELQKKSV